MNPPAGAGPFRFLAVTSALVLAVCVVLAAVAWAVLAPLTTRLDATTGRALGTVTETGVGTVEVRWTPPGGGERTDEVAVAGTPPPAGTRTEVAYDPSGLHGPLVPGAAALADADRALSGLVLAGTTAALVAGATGWHVLARRRLTGATAGPASARRVRVQAGTLARSWLEIESVPRRWLPVHFDAVLLAMPSPAPVVLRGDPLRDRLVAVEVQGRLLWPSGRVRGTEPRGRHTGNPSEPDATAAARGEAAARMRHRFAAAPPQAAPAPLVALLWTWVAGGGAIGWIAATVLLAALGCWYAALRGADPT